MRYVVKAVYREDVKADSDSPPPFSEWFDFKLGEERLMKEVMWAFVKRRYADCEVRVQQHTLEIPHLGVLEMFNVPRFMVWLPEPDRSVILLFDIEVKF